MDEAQIIEGGEVQEKATVDFYEMDEAGATDMNAIQDKENKPDEIEGLMRRGKRKRSISPARDREGMEELEESLSPVGVRSRDGRITCLKKQRLFNQLELVFTFRFLTFPRERKRGESFRQEQQRRGS